MNLQDKTGVVIKNYNGYYYVDCDGEVFACKIRGRFKKSRFSLITGDNVVFNIGNFDGEGSIEDVLPRKNRLNKPAVANVDQIALVFAVKNPDFNQNVFDRFLVSMHKTNVPIKVIFSKIDLLSDVDEMEKIFSLYEKIGYEILKVSIENKENLLQIKEILKDKTTVFAGLSGVGKSTLINNLYPGLNITTGNVSKKNNRGRHTTRFSQIIAVDGAYLLDTPGFSFTEFEKFNLQDVEQAFLEFAVYREQCRFNGCLHIAEPSCAIKEALQKGLLDQTRYENYLSIINEIKGFDERKFK